MSKKPTIAVRPPPASANRVAEFIGSAAETPRLPERQKSKSPDRRQTTIYFDTGTARRLKLHCAATDAEMSATVDAAVRKYLDEIEGQEGAERGQQD